MRSKWTLEQLKSFLGDLSAKDVCALEGLVRQRTGRDLELPIVFIAGHIEDSGLPHWGKVDVEGVCPEHQADAVLDQANPISGDKYTVLDTTEYVRIYTMSTRITWSVQPSPVEIHMTIDGVAHRHFLSNPANNTYYWAKRYESNDEVGQTLRSGDYQAIIAFLIEGRSVKIEAEITGGTVSNLHCRAKWAKW